MDLFSDSPSILISTVLVLAILVVYNMVLISPYLTIFVLIPLPIMSTPIYKVASKIGKISTIVQEEQSSMSTLAHETFSPPEDVPSSNACVARRSS